MPKFEKEIDSYLKRLFPICRSITGEGNRETLKILQELIPLVIKSVPSGQKVYDWIIPDEWNISDAWIKTSDGERLVDFNENNLHVVSYSEPVNGFFSFQELEPHLYTHSEISEAIPYRTTFYHRDWGFCVTQAQYNKLQKLGGQFEVRIDSTLEPGYLNYGELIINGRSEKEILISSYICHPSMANDNLSGVLLTVFLAKELLSRNNLEYSYRVVLTPETIGAITYCFENEQAMKEIDFGLVATTVGGPGKFGYKQSFQKTHPVNTLIEEVLDELGKDYIEYPFDIHGSDERQYSSQAFGINCATICRNRYYEYPYYHSSLDNLDYVSGLQIAETLDLYIALIDKFEHREIYKNVYKHCEVMLSRHELYPKFGGTLIPEVNGKSELDLLLWILFLADGKRSVQDIAAELETDKKTVGIIIDKLVEKELLIKI